MSQPHVVTLSTKGQLVLPRAMRAAAGLHAGSKLSVTLASDGTITARPIKGTIEAFFQSLADIEQPGGLDVDAAIMEAIESLDHAAHQP